MEEVNFSKNYKKKLARLATLQQRREILQQQQQQQQQQQLQQHQRQQASLNRNRPSQKM
jgi:hypothetical protein